MTRTPTFLGDIMRRRRAVLSLTLLAIACMATSADAASAVNCPLNGSVTLTNPNPGQLGAFVSAVPSHGVIEQSVSGNPFFVKKVGDPISWANNSIVNYRNTSAAATDTFSIGGFVFNVTITGAQPPTPTTTTTSDVTITFSGAAQAIGVSAQVSPIPPSGTVTFSIPGAGNNANASVNPQSGSASGTFVVAAGTPSGNYTITATFNGPANYASSSGTATLHINFFGTVTTPDAKVTTYSANSTFLGLSASVTSQFGGTVSTGTVTFTVTDGPTVIGVPASSIVVSNAASAFFTLPAGTPPGSYSIKAEYSGGGNLAPSTGFTTLSVNPPPPTPTPTPTPTRSATPTPTEIQALTPTPTGPQAVTPTPAQLDVPTPTAATTPIATSKNTCNAGKLKCVAAKQACILAAHGKAQKKGVAVDSAAVQKCIDKFDGGTKGFAKGCIGALEAKQNPAKPNTMCALTGDIEILEAKVDSFVDDVVSEISIGATSPNNCNSAKIGCVRKHVACLLNTNQAAEKKGVAVDSAAVGKCEDKFDGGAKGVTKGCIGKLEAKADSKKLKTVCSVTGDLLILSGKVGAFASDMVSTIRNAP